MSFEKWFKKFLPCFECIYFVTEDQLRADLGAAWGTAYQEGKKDGFREGYKAATPMVNLDEEE